MTFPGSDLGGVLTLYCLSSLLSVARAILTVVADLVNFGNGRGQILRLVYGPFYCPFWPLNRGYGTDSIDWIDRFLKEQAF